MTSEQHVSSDDARHINGVSSENEQTTNHTLANSKLRQTHFFRTKRMQRMDTNGDMPKDNISRFIQELGRRSASPPISHELTDESDDNDDGHCQTSATDVPKIVVTQAKQSPVSTNSSFYLKKSHSVKLERVSEHDLNKKKAVRFADDFGLSLSQIKIIQKDELPFIPHTAFKDLKLTNQESSSDILTFERLRLITYVEPQFQNPIYTPDFNERVQRTKVLLEQANAIDNRIYGTIKLISMGFNKRVKVRLTTDNWISYQDHIATYIQNSYDGIYDRFSFVIDIDRHRICAGNNIQFSICYETFVSPDYWDNNYDQNYRFDCYSRAIPDYSI